LAGLITNMVTPFRDQHVDDVAFTAAIERQVAAGADGLLIGSSTAGEGATLRPEERRGLIALAVGAVHGRVTVIVGASSNCTSTTIALVRQALEMGATAAFVTAPWYNRPSQDGVVAHYRAVAQAVDFPIIAGLEPSRTRIDLTDEALQQLAAMPGIVGLMDATGDPARVSAIRQICPHWFLLSGDDKSSLGFLACGGRGAISTSANVAPAAVASMIHGALANDYDAARLWQDRLTHLHAALESAPCPAAVKAALSRLGLCGPDVRLPITPCPQSIGPVLDAAMRQAGLFGLSRGPVRYQPPAAAR
jgi:4-hydroxy-tetrahydrodipicolinate synthase